MEVGRQYSSRSEIKQLEMFCSNGGFRSFHLKWSIGRAPLPITSSVFEAGRVESERNSIRAANYVLSTCYARGNKFGITLREHNCSDENRRNYSMPLMARGMLRVKDSRTTYYGQCVWKNFTNSSYIGWEFPFSTDVEYEFHCWLDVPSYPRNFLNAEPLWGCRSGTELLSSDFENLFREAINDKRPEDDSSDVVLITKQDGVERRFYGHRLILGARSTVFKTMLAGEKFKEARRGVIEIEDINSAAIEVVLKYIYTGQFDPVSSFPRKTHFLEDSIEREKDDAKDMLAQFMNAAEKYALPEMKDVCAYIFMELYAEDEDRLDLLCCAELFRLDWVKNFCAMALSTNMDLFNDEMVRSKLSSDTFGALASMCAKRARSTQVIELSAEQ